jgi:hypothetical protein
MVPDAIAALLSYEAERRMGASASPGDATSNSIASDLCSFGKIKADWRVLEHC